MIVIFAGQMTFRIVRSGERCRTSMPPRSGSPRVFSTAAGSATARATISRMAL
jgi:hypothetical protein